MKEKISTVQELCIAAAQNMFASGSVAHTEYFPLLAVPLGKLVKVEISVVDESETVVPLESDEAVTQPAHKPVTQTVGRKPEGVSQWRKK